MEGTEAKVWEKVRPVGVDEVGVGELWPEDLWIGESSSEGLSVTMIKGETPVGESVTECKGESGKSLEGSELKGKVGQESVEEL